jgi:hypothetical protein
MSWEPGRVRVHEMINAREVEQVTPDLAIAHRMLEDAGRHLATASQAKVAGDLSGAISWTTTPCARARPACLGRKGYGQPAEAGT